MKKWLFMAAVVLLTLPAAAQTREAFPSYIQTNGHAEMEITPDEFWLAVVIDEGDSKGKISVEAQQRDMIAALTKIGIDTDKQLKIDDLSSAFFKKNTALATASYQLELGSAAEVSRAWQALDNLGISNVSISRVSHTKLDQYKNQVRVEAMKNAQQNAKTLAEAVGQTVGKCFYIYDSNSNVMPVFYKAETTRYTAMDSVSAGIGAADPSLDFKTIRLQYDVQAKFVLE